jgi:hypothetical protein
VSGTGRTMAHGKSDDWGKELGNAICYSKRFDMRGLWQSP